MKSLLASGPVLLNCNRHDKLISTENIKVYNLRTLQQATKIPPFTLCSCTLYSVASSNIKRCPFRLHSMSSVVDYVVVWIMGLRYTNTDSDHCAPLEKTKTKTQNESLNNSGFYVFYQSIYNLNVLGFFWIFS